MTITSGWKRGLVGLQVAAEDYTPKVSLAGQNMAEQIGRFGAL
jgi:hypothetical protein